MALNNPLIKSVLVLETRRKLNELGSLNDVNLHGIKAHAGHKFNEVADKLAKKGGTSELRVELPAPNKRTVHSELELVTEAK